MKTQISSSPGIPGIKDELVRQLVSLAREHRVKRLLLFGSRARGDFHHLSDVDLAVSGGNFERFALDVEEYTDTLLKFDIVNLDASVQKELLDSIKKEGIVIYEEI